MADKLIIKDLLVRGYVGINEWEQKKKQDILVNCHIHSDLKKIGQSDDIDDTVNYRTITKQIIAHIEEVKRFSVEHLATQIAKIILNDKRVTKVKVQVEKPGALRFAKSVGVAIERKQGDF